MRMKLLMEFANFCLLSVLVSSAFAETYDSPIKPVVVFSQARTPNSTDLTADTLAIYNGSDNISAARELLISGSEFTAVTSTNEITQGAQHITRKQMDDERLIAVHPARTAGVGPRQYIAQTITNKGVVEANVQSDGEIEFRTRSSKVFYARAEAPSTTAAGI